MNKRLALIEGKRRVSLPALVLFFRAADGLSIEQKQKINTAKQSGRDVKLIKTFVA
ncbi:MAG: hypothetical protein QX199_20715 [Methylococcaceae bacterium]